MRPSGDSEESERGIGDAVSMSLDLGYALASVIFIAVFIVAVAARKDRLSMLLVGFALLGGCAYRGEIDSPLWQRVTWFSYLGGTDIAQACAAGAGERYRIIYNGRYDEQLRSYEITRHGDAWPRDLLAGSAVAGRVRFEPDERVERIVNTWPVALDASRALGLGFPTDRAFEDIIRRYIAEDMPG